MKNLPVPNVDDVAALDLIVGRNPLARCPHLAADVATIRARYIAYVNARGNPLDAGAPRPINLLGRLRNALPNRYEKHADELSYIEEIRSNGSPHVCPMCGAARPTTVDHIFPQNPFKDLAIFSRNLVPACAECNRGRQNRYRGINPGERILHPYFDQYLEQRLLQATITPVAGDFEAPEIGLEVTLAPDDPLFPAVTYHLDTVVKSAGALHALGNLWVNLQRVPALNELPHVFFQTLPIRNFTQADFNRAVAVALRLADEEHHTPNNWKSMLFAGLLDDVPAKTFLAQTIRNLRVRPAEAADI